jgi:hypothetical protein
MRSCPGERRVRWREPRSSGESDDGDAWYATGTPIGRGRSCGAASVQSQGFVLRDEVADFDTYGWDRVLAGW